jgi:hypothetical protein
MRRPYASQQTGFLVSFASSSRRSGFGYECSVSCSGSRGSRHRTPEAIRARTVRPAGGVHAIPVAFWSGLALTMYLRGLRLLDRKGNAAPCKSVFKPLQGRVGPELVAAERRRAIGDKVRRKGAASARRRQTSFERPHVVGRDVPRLRRRARRVAASFSGDRLREQRPNRPWMRSKKLSDLASRKPCAQ